MKILRGHKGIISTIDRNGFYKPKSDGQKRLVEKLVRNGVIIDLTGSEDYVLTSKGKRLA